MIIVVGLGNPGKVHSKQRHNIGFMVLDALAEKKGLHFVEKQLFEASCAQSGDILFVKPLTWMNDSGRAVKMLCKQFCNTQESMIAVLYDDITINLGEVKCSIAKGAGGHNGVQSIIDHLGTKDFFRIRIGVRPVHDELLVRIAPPDGFEKFLLSDFAPFEKELLDQSINKALVIIEALQTKTPEEIMNLYN